jgi:hypothetical protein
MVLFLTACVNVTQKQNSPDLTKNQPVQKVTEKREVPQQSADDIPIKTNFNLINLIPNKYKYCGKIYDMGFYAKRGLSESYMQKLEQYDITGRVDVDCEPTYVTIIRSGKAIEYNEYLSSYITPRSKREISFYKNYKIKIDTVTNPDSSFSIFSRILVGDYIIEIDAQDQPDEITARRLISEAIADVLNNFD